jgi:hypothetical protein
VTRHQKEIRAKYTPEERKARQLSGLRPWQPGQSGNPNGRPKRPESIASKLIRFDNLPAPEAMTRPIYDAFPQLEGTPLTIDDVTWINVKLAGAANSAYNIDFYNRKVEGDSVNVQFTDNTPQRHIDPSKLKMDTKKLIRQVIQQTKVNLDAAAGNPVK